MTMPFLTLLVVLPLVGAALLFVTGRGQDKLVRNLALGVSLVTFALSLIVWMKFDPASADYQFVERHAWLPDFGISYHVGIDGISLLLVVLTTFLTPIALLCSWDAIEDRVRAFSFFMLVLEAAMIGVFISLDLFLFYMFWDAMLIPMYFLIGIWGHERRIYAAVKFFLYTMAGSALMLVAFLVLYRESGLHTFDILKLTQQPVAPALQTWLFLAFALAFAIKVPMWPFHTWLPDAHVEAPTAGSVILAGVLLKMGGYGFLRLAIPLFPNAAHRFAPLLGVLAVIGIVHGALVSLVQPDMKKLVAYSSVSHLGFVMLGIASFSTTALVGSVYQMLNHGISTGALFFMVGMLYDRRHTRAIADFGGLKTVMPWFSALFLLVCLSSIAVPGFNGFVGEFLILMGSWGLGGRLVAVATLGVILSAAYILWMVERVLYGEVTHEENKTLPDLSLREAAILVPLVALALFMGVASPVFTRKIEPSVEALVAQVRSQTQVPTRPAPPPRDAAQGPGVPANPVEARE
jgi:NADH-quinone oxidoreductase subunit M